MELADIADDCCYRDGQPWPPLPEPTDTPTPTDLLTELAEAMSRDTCTLRLRNPYAEDWTPSTVLCARLHQLRSAAALEEWLQHHRCAWLMPSLGTPLQDTLSADRPPSVHRWNPSAHDALPSSLCLAAVQVWSRYLCAGY